MGDTDTLRLQLQALLAKRDAAVAMKDAGGFLATQLHEIPGSHVGGYLSLASLRSELIHAHMDGNDPRHVIALVKETYVTPEDQRNGFLIYYLFSDGNSLRISNIAWANPSWPDT